MTEQTNIDHVPESSELWARIGSEYFAVEVQGERDRFAETGGDVSIWGSHYDVAVDRNFQYGQLFTSVETLKKHSWLLHHFREHSLPQVDNARIVKVIWDGSNGQLIEPVENLTR